MTNTEQKAQYNVYVKLQSARVRLQAAGLKKTGENTYSHFKYFQLDDFLPTVNKIFEDLGLCSVFSITGDTAVLTIVNAEDTAQAVTFTSPVAEAGIKGASAIQQLGGIHTYMRRYLWLMAMEITEADTVDSLPEEKKTQGTALDIIQAPATMIDELKRLYTSAELAQMIKRRGWKSLNDVTSTVGADWIAHRTGVNSNIETF